METAQTAFSRWCVRVRVGGGGRKRYSRRHSSGLGWEEQH